MPEWQDTFLTVDAAGNIGANFSGHFTAAGVDLTAPAAAPASINQVRWIRQTDGAVVAFIDAFDNLATQLAQMDITLDGSIDAADAIMVMRTLSKDTLSNPSALLQLHAHSVAGGSEVRAVAVDRAGTGSVKIVAGDGASDFARGPTFGNFQAFPTTGLHSITGVGFKPKAVLFIWQRNTVSFGPSSNHLAWGYGMMKADGTAFSFMQAVPDSGTPAGLNGMDFNTSVPLLCKFFNNSGGWTAFFSSMDADGFTLNVTAVASTDYRIMWIAF